jgi:hypothetical protein
VRRTADFTVLAMVSLAPGIGVNTTILTLIGATRLAPIPVERSSVLAVACPTLGARTLSS